MADGVETDGGLAVTGGGKLTFTGSLVHSGGTTVEAGTKLVIPDTCLGGGLRVSFPEDWEHPESGTETTLVTTTGDDVFSEADLPDVSAFAYYRAKLSDDAKSILIKHISPTVKVKELRTPSRKLVLEFADLDTEQDVVVAWNYGDKGSKLSDWDYDKRRILGTVPAGTTTATFTLPDDVLLYLNYRVFIGDGATEPYDSEVEWIQPASSGAYMKTGYVPVECSRGELKFNMDSQTYDGNSDYKTIVGTTDGWPRKLCVSVNKNGWMQNVRAGTMRFAKSSSEGFSKTDDHTVKLNFANKTTCFTIDGKNDDEIYHEYTDNDGSTNTRDYNTMENIVSTTRKPTRFSTMPVPAGRRSRAAAKKTRIWTFISPGDRGRRRHPSSTAKRCSLTRETAR